MGLFSGIKNTYKKSEAAVVVENLLEHLRQTGLFVAIPGVIDPPKMANMLVEAAWNSKPDVFNGTFGNRPHKLSVAAYALATGIERLEVENPLRPTLSIALGNIMQELQTNGRLYPFNNVDNFLLEKAVTVFGILAEEIENDPIVKSLERRSSA